MEISNRSKAVFSIRSALFVLALSSLPGLVCEQGHGVWNLARSSIGYPHSSAGFYETGKQGIYEVTNVKELDDINLTK